MTRSISRATGTTRPVMRMFNSYVRIERNWAMERHILLERNVMPARRNSISQPRARPVLSVQRIRRHSVHEPPRIALHDENFAAALRANVEREDREHDGDLFTLLFFFFIAKNW